MQQLLHVLLHKEKFIETLGCASQQNYWLYKSAGLLNTASLPLKSKGNAK